MEHQKFLNWLSCKGILTAALAAAVILLGRQAGAQTFDAETVERSIVKIVACEGPQQGCWSGTGFVLNDQGLVGTNWHVVVNEDGKGPAAIGYILASGSTERYSYEVLWMDEELDLAIVKVGAGFKRPKLPLATGLPKKGKDVFALGFPGVANPQRGGPAVDATVTAGILGRIYTGTWKGKAAFPVLQHSAHTNPGNSGGPLFDACGRVIGVNTQAALISVVKPDGRLARVAKATGIFWSSQITVLMKKMQDNNVPFQPVTTACKVEAPGGKDVEARKQAAEATRRLEQQEATIARTEGVLKEFQIEIKGLEGKIEGLGGDIAGLGGQVDSITTQLLVWGPIFALFMIVTFVLALRKPRQQVIRVAKEYSQRFSRYGEQVSRRVSPPTGAQAAAESGICLSGFDATGASFRQSIRASDLSGKGAVLGRSPEFCRFVIRGQGVSRRQIRMSVERGRIMIEDLKSTNGTCLNGRKLSPYKPAEIRPGDQLSFGKTELSVSKL